ncbi:MAG: L,D-transpeptidase family protein [Steroidobacteraceae bacterium]
MLRRFGLVIALAVAAFASAGAGLADNMPAPLSSAGVAAGGDGGAHVGDTAELPSADRAVVRKSERRLYLMKGDSVVRSYRIALGLQPAGSKERSGDFRTPEGEYQLTRRNAHSDYFLSIQVSYPNAADLERARRNRWQVGGSIMVHGMPNYLRHSPDYYATADWTDGCIALSNADMVEFWLLSHDNMPIDIMP